MSSSSGPLSSSLGEIPNRGGRENESDFILKAPTSASEAALRPWEPLPVWIFECLKFKKQRVRMRTSAPRANASPNAFLSASVLFILGYFPASIRFSSCHHHTTTTAVIARIDSWAQSRAPFRMSAIPAAASSCAESLSSFGPWASSTTSLMTREQQVLVDLMKRVNIQRLTSVGKWFIYKFSSSILLIGRWWFNSHFLGLSHVYFWQELLFLA